MRIRLGLILTAVGLGAVPSAATAAPLTLEPSSDWKVRSYEDKCRLSRTFGSGEDRVALWLDQGSETPSYNLTAIGRPLRNPYGPNVSLQFAPEPEYSRAYIQAKSSKGRPVLSLFGVRLTPNMEERELLGIQEEQQQADPETPGATRIPRGATGADIITTERIAAVSELRLGRAVTTPLTLKTGSLSQPLADLQECTKKMIAALEVNLRLGRSAATPKDQARWAKIISQNYPPHLQRAEEQASVGVQLTIGKNGRPSFCEIIKVEGLTSFNDTVCLLMMKHATFNPALDMNGEPTIGQFRTTVTYRLN